MKRYMALFLLMVFVMTLVVFSSQGIMNPALFLFLAAMLFLAPIGAAVLIAFVNVLTGLGLLAWPKQKED